MYIDKLDDIVDEYNDTYHRAIKMKPVEVKDNTLLKILDFKLVIMWEYQNTKTFLLKGFQRL